MLRVAFRGVAVVGGLGRRGGPAAPDGYGCRGCCGCGGRRGPGCGCGRHRSSTVRVCMSLVLDLSKPVAEGIKASRGRRVQAVI